MLGVESIDAEQAKATLCTSCSSTARTSTARPRSSPWRRGTESGAAARSVLDLLPASWPSCAGPASRCRCPSTSMRPRRLQHVPLEDREAIKYALGATLVKSASHWRAFETAFEVYFSMRGPQYSTVDDGVVSPGRGRRRQRGLPAGPGGRGRGRGAAARACSAEELAGAALRALSRRRLGVAQRRGPPGRATATPAWSRGARWAAPTTSTARCGTSTSTTCWTASSPRRAPRRWARCLRTTRAGPSSPGAAPDNSPVWRSDC